MRRHSKESIISKRLLAFDESICPPEREILMAGIDEAGRGPLAGPVVAASVILPPKTTFPFLNDSKQVSPARREILYQQIVTQAVVGIGIASLEEIDSLNIYQATRLAMARAVRALAHTPDLLLIDGKMQIDVLIPQKSIVQGDAQSASIAAASIIAKVYRDCWMAYLDEVYPDYGFKQHKGYGTREHLRKLKELGPSPVHRKDFIPAGDFAEFEGFLV